MLNRKYQYAANQSNNFLKVVNQDHSKLTYEIKKLNEKLATPKTNQLCDPYEKSVLFFLDMANNRKALKQIYKKLLKMRKIR